MQSSLTTVFRKLTIYQFLNAVYDGDLTVVGYSLKARCSMQWSNPCTHVSDGAPSNFPVVTSHHFTRHANQWMMHVQASYCYRNHPPMSIPTHTQLLYVACMFCILQQLLCVLYIPILPPNCSMYVCMFCILQQLLYVCVYVLYTPPTALCVCVYVLYTPTTSLCMCVCFDTTPNCSMYVCMFCILQYYLPTALCMCVCVLYTVHGTKTWLPIVIMGITSALCDHSVNCNI